MSDQCERRNVCVRVMGCVHLCNSIGVYRCLISCVCVWMRGCMNVSDEMVCVRVEELIPHWWGCMPGVQMGRAVR